MARKTQDLASETQDLADERATGPAEDQVDEGNQEPEQGEAPEVDKVDEAGATEVEDLGDPPAQDWEPEGPLEFDTLVGDVRDLMLSRIRQMRKPWQQMSEAEQRDTAEGIASGARHLVRKTVRLLSTYEWPHCVVTLGEVKIKGEKGIEAKIGAANVEENRNVLGDYVGQFAMLVMVDSETFMGTRGEVQIDPDQPELPGGDEPDPEPEESGEAVESGEPEPEPADAEAA